MKPGSFNYIYGSIIYCRIVVITFLITCVLIYILDPKTIYLVSSLISGKVTFPLFALFFLVQLYTICALTSTSTIHDLGLNLIHVVFLGWILSRLNK
jgi:hypothetical protein